MIYSKLLAIAQSNNKTVLPNTLLLSTREDEILLVYHGNKIASILHNYHPDSGNTFIRIESSAFYWHTYSTTIRLNWLFSLFESKIKRHTIGLDKLYIIEGLERQYIYQEGSIPIMVS